MTIYYVDPDDAGGSPDGSESDPWQDLQDAVDAVVAGDVVLCKGTQTLNAGTPINDASLASGDATDGHIFFIGCDSSFGPRLGQFTLDGDTNAVDYCLQFTNGADRIWFENFTFSGGDVNAVSETGANMDYCMYKKCIFEGAGADGVDGTGIAFSILDECIIRDNAGDGIGATGNGVNLRLCSFIGNGGRGLLLNNYGSVHDCLFHDNEDGHIECTGTVIAIHGNVLDGSGSGFGVKIVAGKSRIQIVYNRITHNATNGIEMTSAREDSNTEDWNGFFNNGANRSNILAGLNSQALTADGYRNRAGHDFNLVSQAEMRHVAVSVDWG